MTKRSVPPWWVVGVVEWDFTLWWFKNEAARVRGVYGVYHTKRDHDLRGQAVRRAPLHFSYAWGSFDAWYVKVHRYRKPIVPFKP